MEDEEIVQYQMDLVNALQNRVPLRSISPSAKPSYIGGLKSRPSSPRLTSLQAEFLQSSVAMQMRLRPQLARMEEIRRESERSTWNAIQRDIKEAFKRRQERWEEYDGVFGGGPLLACQIVRRLEERPGWEGLLAEVREGSVVLEPVEVEGFYVIKSGNELSKGRVNAN